MAGESQGIRLLRLWRLYAYLDLVWVTRDLKSAVLYICSDAISTVATVTAMLLLAERFQGIGSWTKFQVVFLLSYAMVVRGLLDFFFSYNVLFISRRVGRGQLDHLLIQPQPLWMGLLTEGFAPFGGSGILVPGLGLMIWATSRLPLVVSIGWTALLAVNLIASAVIIVSYTFLWGSLAFWAPRAAEEINSSTVRLFDQLMSFPLDGLGPGLLGGLLTVVPVGFVAWYPCRSLLGLGTGQGSRIVTPLVALLMAALAGWMFRLGLKHYGRTGSQRYLSLGHRG
jgi:ABC-2 type transport system permease protein